jgi:DNA processing protein
MPLDFGPMPGLFPQRNRIISGLSLGVIVVEASQKSGALHTARHAMEQGREVYAVPGRVDSLASEGCHALIRDGATLIRTVDDVLESLGPLCGPLQSSAGSQVLSPRELTLGELERDILNRVGLEPTHVDEVLRSSDIESGRVLSTLTVLEMKRMIRRLPGGFLIRVTQ